MRACASIRRLKKRARARPPVSLFLVPRSPLGPRRGGHGLFFEEQRNREGGRESDGGGKGRKEGGGKGRPIF